MKITLRQFTDADRDLLVDYLNCSEVTQYITAAIPSPYTVVDANGWIEYANKTEYIYAIEYQGLLVGAISAQVGAFEYKRSAELGYWVAKRYWNQGIATQAVSLCCELLFTQTKLNRLFVSVVSENGASIRVLEKNGFKIEGILKQASFKEGVYFDEHLLAITK
ncbi:GNAT family N-acetyltransferase [Psychrobium sp. 1_MG-2023]|uniref:GNAT family N-acetyltransferase n=1 Tax=Psychrobium sp. 1_MG-2023 TaxID=3062624 RepID=UPI002735EFA2|nr:GNAT family protein [Psychrobium sp. 1_MG-2023]MDP2562468.1 GNAT family protein [Psychrobium sp. 1_MG-2023]